MKDDGHHRQKILGKFTLIEIVGLIIFSPCLLIAVLISFLILIIGSVMNIIFGGK